MTRSPVFLLLALSACSEQSSGKAPAADAPDAGKEAREILPPPISGGTLLITRDGQWAVASDPDTDRVAIVDTAAGTASPKLLADVELARGEEPGRLAEDGDGRVHVVLRRGRAIATIDLKSGALLARRPVCVAPRGIAFAASANSLHVACASGDLVTLTPDSGEVTRRIRLEPDLRDVVVVPEGLIVSRFKSASLLLLDAQGNILMRVSPTGIERASQDLSLTSADPLESAVAWRTVNAGPRGVFVLHQYGLTRALDLGKDATVPVAPYRATGSCGGIVAQTVSTLAPGAGELQMGMPLPVAALSVDVATSKDGEWLAVAHPGARGDKVTIYRSGSLPTLGRSPVRCAEHEGRVIVEAAEPVAVAMHPGKVPGAVTDSDWLIVQTRNPRKLLFYSGFSTPRASVSFPGPVVQSRGHHLFHVDAGSGIACAQCHPEGGEDGRVWRFLPIGVRRTQALNVGLESTAPFHWDGDLVSLRTLVSDVFVRRMGLPEPDRFHLEAIERWLLSLPSPDPIGDFAAEPALRGRALFESEAVGCTRCHAGAAVAANTNFDVGVEPPHAFQIPSLRGIGYRAPFLHNGCAQTLRDRFEPVCGGGDLHGRTSQLSSAEIDDLVSYLESL